MASGGGAEAASIKAINTSYHLVSDGSRFVAYQRPDGTPMILDVRKGKVRRIKRAKGCQPAAVGNRLVLINCSKGYHGDFRPSRLASVLTGKSWAIPGSSRDDDYKFGDIGKHWVRAGCQSPSPCYWTTYTNYRTGTRKGFTTVGVKPKSVPEGLGYSDYDLNYKHLGRFKPHPDFSIFTDDFNWRTYLGYGAHYYLLNETRGMYLVRGPQRRVRIGGFLRGTDSIYETRIIARGSGRIAWVRGKRLRAYDLRSGKKILRKLPRKATRLAVIKQGAVISIPTGVKQGNRSVSRLRIVRF